MKNIITFNLLLAVTIILTACGGDNSTNQDLGSGNDPGANPLPNTTINPNSLLVLATSPVVDATQKSDFPIVAVFSEPVDEMLVDSSSFSVTDGINPVVGTFSYSEDKTVVIFTPTSSLVDAVNYTVTLNTSLASATSKTLAANVTWSFVAKDAATYSCVVTAPPPGLNLNAYYTQYCDANGMPVIGGDLVNPLALQEAWSQTMNMMKMRQDLFAEMIKQGTKVAIVAYGEGITQIPEYSDLDTVFPLAGGQSWDDRARGLGATTARPVSSGADENLLCSLLDPYYGENIFLHEFAHSVEGMGIVFADPGFSAKIQAAYENALATGLFANTYADDTVYEYWAEGVQDWFDVNLETLDGNPDGVHNHVNTRAELQTYDPALYSLISNIFPADWKPVACP